MWSEEETIAQIDLSVSDSGQIFILLSLFHTLLTHRNNDRSSLAAGQRGNIITPILHTTGAKVT